MTRPAGPGTVLHLFLSLVTLRHAFWILYLRHASPGTIVCIPLAEFCVG
jgi:hypothetical protein